MLLLMPSLSFLLCLACTPVVRHISLKKDWIAYPTKQRWHKKPTALLGGIAIYFGIGTALFLIADFSTLAPHFFRTFDTVNLPSLGAAIWLGMTFLFILGLLDDFFNIKPPDQTGRADPGCAAGYLFGISAALVHFSNDRHDDYHSLDCGNYQCL